MKKSAKSIIWTIIGVVTVVACSLSIFFTVKALVNEKKRINNLAHYDNVYYFDLETESNNQLPESSKAFDYYNNNSSSIFVAANRQDGHGSVGTIWSYPINNNDGRYYFATNIHVVKDAFQIPLSTNGTEKISIKPNAFFAVNRNQRNKLEIYGNSNQIYRTELEDVRLETIGIEYQKPYGIKLGLTSKYQDESKYSYYSDYCILSTTTNPFGKSYKPATFATKDEIEKYVFNLCDDDEVNKRNDLYLSGFPANNEGSSDAIRYYHARIAYDKLVNDFESHIKHYLGASSVGVSLTSTSKNVLKQNYKNSAMYLGGQEMPNPIWSYARHLLLPNAIIGGGSSGSVVSTIINGEMKIVGIWWGGWSGGSKDGWFSDKIQFLGGADLFVTGEYTSNKATFDGYDHTGLNPNSLYWKYGVPSRRNY